VPILVKIDQEMQPWECSQMDTHTDTSKPILWSRVWHESSRNLTVLPAHPAFIH